MMTPLTNIPNKVTKYLAYNVVDMANRSVKSREKFVDLLTTYIGLIDRRSEIQPDGLRYNQTNSYSYQGNYTFVLYMLKIGIDSGCITRTEGGEYLEAMLEAHYENLEYEILHPPIDYSKPVPKVKAKRAKAEPKEKKPREAKSKIKIDFTGLNINLKDIL
jgi:hypothetical protein